MLNSVLRGALCALVFLANSAWAVTVHYEVSDLPDIAAGQDRWLYSYTLSGDFAEFEGVTVIYGSAAYANLALDSAPDAADFAAVLVEPDASLAADGLLTLSANRVVSAETFEFAVSFDWLRTGRPESQPFETFDEFFSITGNGNTAQVPEPATWPLMFVGVAGLIAFARRSPSSMS